VRLIVTEKDSAAQKIAQILGKHVQVTEHGRGRQRVKSYAFDWDGAPTVAVGLRGHVMETTFPNTYRRWSLKYLDQMIREPDLAWVIDGASASTVAALRSVAKGATEVIVATDYDREGELIGEEALRILRGDALRRHPHDKPEKPARGAGKKAAGRARPAPTPPPAFDGDGDGDGDEGGVRLKAVVPPAIVDRHHRARYSALTPDEVKRAFSKLDTLDFKLADAAHTRQDIDLIWGAVLTRFMSLASYRYGSDYLSIGRVQTPTLRLVVDRELERRAFVPVPYWEIKAELEAGSGERFTVEHARGRFADAPTAEAALAGAQTDSAEVTAYATTPRSLAPPAPFNTTALMSAASGAGVAPSRAMKAAESLYLDGLISYPRTDNTVYPPSLDLRAVLREVAGHRPISTIAAELADQATLKPTRGKKRTTDHPPIYPVGVPRTELHGDQARVYDLVVRRFLATLLPAAVIESQRLDVLLGSEPFVGRGSRVAKPGFLRAWQPYTADRERPLPQAAVGDVLVVLGVRLDAKETQPPSRFGQGPLIEKMEELDLGTKATRADIIQHLYDRNYVRDNPVEPTELGIAVIRAFDAAMPSGPLDISSPAMTARLEEEMDRIALGDLRKERVVGDSQELLAQAHKALEGQIDAIRAEIKGAVREDMTLGTCATCGGELRILRGKTGKRFVACVGKEGDEAKVPEGAPEGTRPRRGCGQTFPLPQRGAIIAKGTSCPTCGWPEITVLTSSGRGRPWQLCLDPDCPTKENYKKRASKRPGSRGAASS
jgi:DNA topoisomerase-1